VEPIPLQLQVRVPFTFHDSPTDEVCARLQSMAEAYRQYTTALQRGWILRTAAASLIGVESRVAIEMSALLDEWAGFMPLDAMRRGKLRGLQVDIRSTESGCRRNVTLVTWPNMSASRSMLGFAHLAVSYESQRVAVEDSPARLRSGAMQLVRVPQRPANLALDPLTFDGVISRWHGPGYRCEIDRVTGRQRLHLCLSETTFFTFKRTQQPVNIERNDPFRYSARVLSVLLLAHDDDLRVLLIKRSRLVMHAHCYAATVSGNCELSSRLGLHADLDHRGLPDLLRAVKRETREELGLDLDSYESRLSALGIFEVNNELEVGSHVLVATARSPVPATEFTAERFLLDPIEGEWEIGDTARVVDVGTALRDREAGQRLVRWLRTDPVLVPHTAGAILLLLAAHVELREGQERRATGRGLTVEKPPWGADELWAWCTESMPLAPPDMRDLVFDHELWRTDQ